MKTLLQIVILLLIIGCQNNEDEKFSLNKNQYQKFEVSCDSDTILVSKEGVKIKIKANTFKCSNNKKIDLRFVAIMNKSDMILNEFYTVNEDGEFLESGGMFHFIDNTNDSKSFEYPIKLEIPTSIANSKMTKHLSKNNNDMLVWSDTKKIIEIGNDENSERGKKLFNQNCTSCHSRNLRADLTGPALGNVHLYRDRDWLIEYTRNSMQMISQGDSLAVCLFQKWNTTLMSSYPQLSDEDIEDVYDFIANESRIQAIGINEIDYLTECEIDTTLFRPIVNLNDKRYSYLLEIQSNNWVNVDYLIPFPSKIEPIKLVLDKQYESLVIVMTFQERNIVIPFEQNEVDKTKYRLLFSKDKEKINFPIGEMVNIIAYSDVEDFEFKIIDYKPKSVNNILNLSLEKRIKSEFLKEIKKL